MIDKYYVTSVKGFNISDIDDELISEYGSDTIPERQVEFADKIISSERVSEFWLTEQEAESLKADPRVFDVERHQKEDEYWIDDNSLQYGDFRRTGYTTDVYNDLRNWGLARCTAKSNANFQKVDNKWLHKDYPNEVYQYNSAGDGVDIVIIDRSCQGDHPEFEDEHGNCRLQKINWETELTDMGWQDTSWTSNRAEYRKPEYYYNETVTNHGTPCASIAAGKENGWAKKAKIYHCNTPHNIPDEPINGGDNVDLWWPRLLYWVKERKKSGNKRPVVISMSIGKYYREHDYIASYVTGGSYRGVEWTRDGETNQELYDLYGIENGKPMMHSSGWSAIIDELTEEGVHVVIAGGNHTLRQVKPDHQDWDNYYTYQNTNKKIYYCRGAWVSENSYMVGAIDNDPLSDGQDKISAYSSRGSGIDIYAPADYTVAASGNGYTGFAEWDYPSETHKSRFFSGTSAACPQVAGIIACYLSVKPHLTPKDMKTILLGQSDIGSLFEYSGKPTQGGFVDSNNKIVYMAQNYGTDVTYYNQTLSNVIVGGNWKIHRVMRTEPRGLIPDLYLNKVTGYFEGYEVDPRSSISRDRQFGTLNKDDFAPFNLYATIKGIFYKYNEKERTTTFNLKVTGDIQNSGWESLFVSLNYHWKGRTVQFVYKRKDAKWSEATGTWQWDIPEPRLFANDVEYFIGIV